MKSVRRLKPCCAKTLMERTKVRQATVFLAKQPRETKVNKKKSNEFNAAATRIERPILGCRTTVMSGLRQTPERLSFKRH